MNQINYSKFKNSLERLREMHENYLAKSKTDIPVNLREAIQESVTHRFEVCFNTLWKTVKRHLKAHGVTSVPAAPKPIFRATHQNNLIDTKTLENFLDHTDTRMAAARDYTMENIEQTLEKVKPFIRDATELHEILTEAKAIQ